MNPSVTIVLPITNAELFISRTIHELLDVVQSTARPFQLTLVDNGSTDDTYEVAYQLSRRFPQITVLWLPVWTGLGGVIDLVRDRVTSERILLHDGVSPICAMQLGSMLAHPPGARKAELERKPRLSTAGTIHLSHQMPPNSKHTKSIPNAGRSAGIAADQSQSAFESVTGFQWFSQAESRAGDRKNPVSPSLPLPTFLSAGTPLPW